MVDLIWPVTVFCFWNWHCAFFGCDVTWRLSFLQFLYSGKLRES